MFIIIVARLCPTNYLPLKYPKYNSFQVYKIYLVHVLISSRRCLPSPLPPLIVLACYLSKVLWYQYYVVGAKHNNNTIHKFKYTNNNTQQMFFKPNIYLPHHISDTPAYPRPTSSTPPQSTSYTPPDTPSHAPHRSTSHAPLDAPSQVSSKSLSPETPTSTSPALFPMFLVYSHPPFDQLK